MLFVVLGVVALGGSGKLRNVVYRLGTGDYTHTRIGEAEKVQGVDILFVGSSHAYRSFDPRYYAGKGLRTFNLGSSNQTPLQSEMMMRLYLDKMRPRMVVMEVHPDMVEGDGVESAIMLANNMKPSVEMACMAIETRNVKAVLSMLYSAVCNTLGRDFRRYEEPLSDAENEYVAGGYVARKGGSYEAEEARPVEIRLNPLQVRATEKIVEMTGRRGIPCLLVKVPDSRTMSRSYANIKEFEERMSSIGPFRSIEVAALSDTLHFYDPTHLNQAGVELFEEIFYETVLVPFMDKHGIE